MTSTKKPEKREFTCHMCGTTFPTMPGWSDEDAEQECRDEFDYLPPVEDRAIVCTECYENPD